MSFNEILEQLPKLTEDEKRQLWNILDQELADVGFKRFETASAGSSRTASSLTRAFLTASELL